MKPFLPLKAFQPKVLEMLSDIQNSPFFQQKVPLQLWPLTSSNEFKNISWHWGNFFSPLLSWLCPGSYEIPPTCRETQVCGPQGWASLGLTPVSLFIWTSFSPTSIVWNIFLVILMLKNKQIFFHSTNIFEGLSCIWCFHRHRWEKHSLGPEVFKRGGSVNEYFK